MQMVTKTDNVIIKVE